MWRLYVCRILREDPGTAWRVVCGNIEGAGAAGRFVCVGEHPGRILGLPGGLCVWEYPERILGLPGELCMGEH